MKIGADMPIHSTRHFPACGFKEPPTSIEKRIGAQDIQGRGNAVRGNAPGHRHENTRCPNRGEILIKRCGCGALECSIEKNKCPKCRFEIGMRGSYIKKER